jgi:hypothetical protein
MPRGQPNYRIRRSLPLAHTASAVVPGGLLQYYGRTWRVSNRFRRQQARYGGQPRGERGRPIPDYRDRSARSAGTRGKQELWFSAHPLSILVRPILGRSFARDAEARTGPHDRVVLCHAAYLSLRRRPCGSRVLSNGCQESSGSKRVIGGAGLPGTGASMVNSFAAGVPVWTVGGPYGSRGWCANGQCPHQHRRAHRIFRCAPRAGAAAPSPMRIVGGDDGGQV